jgi:putative ABC transport system permease protein
MIGKTIASARSLWRALRRRDGVEHEMDEEFRLHLALRAEHLVREGLSPADAERQARLEFGSAEHHKDRARQARGLRRFDDLAVSWLDFKLGFRMLSRYPGLTLVGGLAMAFAMWVGAGAFEMVVQVVAPRLPLPGGDRIVTLRNWDAATSRVERRALSDFDDWREQLTTVRDLGAWRPVRRNLITGEGRGEPITVVETSASAFRVTQVPPALGRTLVDADEQPGAPNVVVIGHELWQRRFAGDSGIVGTTIRLGTVEQTIVGVMPQGYAFPVSHEFWAPLRLNARDVAPREGPTVTIFGRLADGVGMDEARSELVIVGGRAARAFPETHRNLRPQLLPYTRSVIDLGSLATLGVMSINVPVVMLLVLIFGNVALLLFARAATRESEILVRTALGASRTRIVTQLFAEALVLGGLATLVGLSAAGAGLRWVVRVVEAEFMDGAPLPFWFHGSLSPSTLVYAVLLALLGAAIAGVMPALKVTRGLSDRLRQAAAGGGGLRFGGVWTVVIVLQVAVTVVAPVFGFFTRKDEQHLVTYDPGVPAHEYVSAQVDIDRTGAGGVGAVADTTRAGYVARWRRTTAELERRLAAEPGVLGVTFADRLPRMYHPHRLVDVDEGGAAPLHRQWPAYRVSNATVAPDYFAEMGAPVRNGRSFSEADVVSGAKVVIVNESFVRLVLGGRNPIGRRLRYVKYEEREPLTPEEKQAEPWYEIVGVVKDLGMSTSEYDPKKAGIYHPVSDDGPLPAQMAIHVRGDPMSFATRIRQVATAVDPDLRLYTLGRLDQIDQGEIQFYQFWVRMLALLCGVALTLSLAGIYAVMSFTVARRTREIGIRRALGSEPRQIVLAIFRRPLWQVTGGVVLGGAVIGSLMMIGAERLLSPKEALVVTAYTLAMLAICLLACVIPTRRALAVEPTEALRAES